MKGKVLSDWMKADVKSGVGRRKVFGALQHFLDAPQKEYESGRRLMESALQNYAQTGDFPTSVLQVIEKFHATTHFDEAWQEVFDTRDFRASKRNGFDVTDVEDGLTFSEVPTAGAAHIYKMAGTKTTVPFAKYGGGLGWDRILFDDEEYWTLEDNAIAFRNKAGLKRSEIFYALIDAVSAGQDLAWQTVTPAGVTTANENYNAIRDINTINKACENILTDLADTGLTVGPSSSFLVLAPIQLKARLLRAMGLLNAGISGPNFDGLVYNAAPIFTQMLSSSTSYYVILPKQKIKAGIRMDLTVFDEFDPNTYSDIAVGWMRFGGAILEQNQFQRCATS